jgi:hypothetical protein
VKAPPDWKVTASPIRDPATGGWQGDQLNLRKPDDTEHQADHGITSSGWLEVLISTQPFVVEYRPDEGTLVVDQRLTDLVEAIPPSAPRAIQMITLGVNPQFPEYRGAIVFTSPGHKPGGLFLNLFATIHVDADPRDIAIVRQIIASVEVLK